MKFKSDYFSCFKVFCATFEKMSNHEVKSLRTGKGGEYMSKEFTKYLKSAGIRHEPGPPESTFTTTERSHRENQPHNQQSGLFLSHKCPTTKVLLG
jgi:hypothetical protein